MTAPATPKKPTTKRKAKVAALPDFEASLKELETLVETMEAGEQSLDQSLQSFERGIKLTRECQQALEQAEQRVQVLLQQNGKSVLSDFAALDESGQDKSGQND